MTETMREALELLEVKVLDHVVVGAGKPVSMAALHLI
jgi:DNA repair protein RadC